MADFRIAVNLEQIAKDMNTTVDSIYERVRGEAEKLSISTHAFIVRKAQNDLDGFLLKTYLGKNNENVRWVKVNDNMYVVEVDESVGWIEEGRAPTSMATESWLLKPGKAKRAKDGSLYRVIPMTQARFAGGGFDNPKTAYETMIKGALRENNINLKKIERDEFGNPKMGILHKVNIEAPFSQEQTPGMYSKPRTAEDAAKSGLKQHGGIFHLSGLAVLQRKGAKGGTVREAVTFRVVSSKHQAEGRWVYPQVKEFGGIKAANEYAKEQWDKIVEQLNREFNSA